MNIKRILSDNLVKRRAHLTQKEVADKAYMPLGTYLTYEYGRRMPGAGNLQKLAIALQCDAGDLLKPYQSPALMLADLRLSQPNTSLINRVTQLPQHISPSVLELVHMLTNLNETRVKSLLAICKELNKQENNQKINKRNA